MRLLTHKGYLHWADKYPGKSSILDPGHALGHGSSISSGVEEATSGYPRPSSRLALAFVGGMVRIMLVFVCISVAWVFFKLPTFSDATAYMTGIFNQPLAHRFPAEHYWLAAIYASPVMVQHGWILLKGENDGALNRRLEPILYGLLITLAVVEAGPDAAFIYFQF